MMVRMYAGGLVSGVRWSFFHVTHRETNKTVVVFVEELVEVLYVGESVHDVAIDRQI
jgi:hypothetical protein